jgi:hypothetical protein
VATAEQRLADKVLIEKRRMHGQCQEMTMGEQRFCGAELTDL